MKFKYSYLLLLLATALLATPGCKKDDDDDDQGGSVQPLLLDCSYATNTTLTNRNPNGVDYYATCMVAITGGTFTIEPGVTIAFESGAGISVDENGSLKAVGTSSDLITFTTRTGSSSWAGLSFYNVSTNNELTRCVIENAGNDNQYLLDGTPEPGAVLVAGRLRMANTTIKDSENHGLVTTQYGVTLSLPGFQNNTFEGNNGYPIVLEKDILNGLDVASCTYRSNTYQNIKLVATSAGSDRTNLTPYSQHTWQDAGVPYYVNEGFIIADGASLVLEQGVHLLFDGDGYIEVTGTNNSSFLKANGTNSNPIIMEGTQAQAGFWDGLGITTNSQNNLLNYVTIRHAGNNAYFYSAGSEASLRIGNYFYGNTKVSLNNVNIEQSTGCGMVVYDHDGTGAVPTSMTVDQNNVSFVNIADNDICFKTW